MESQAVQSTVIDADKLQQLEEEIEQEMQEILKTSNIRNLLEKYGVAGENVIKIQLNCEIEMAHSQSNNDIDNQPVQTFLAGVRPPNILKIKCCEDWLGNCVKC